jgi:RNA polymerase sigma-70 factor (ECF subfamily)
MSPGDLELLQIAAAQQDVNAFAPLYEHYVDIVWRYARSRLGDSDLAADATSAVFQRALTALPSYQPRRSGDGTTFRAWLMTIARNVVIDELRRHPTTSLATTTVQHRLVDDGRSPAELAIAREEQDKVNVALGLLPEKQRQIVELRLMGLKSIEIATQLGMSLSAVKTAHFRAYARLRDLLGPDAEGGQQRGNKP